MTKITAKSLAKEWGVEVRHSLYREDGSWYHCLKRFPGALFDAHGYVLFESKEEYENYPELIVEYEKDWSNIRRGGRLSDLPGYRIYELPLFSAHSEEPHGPTDTTDLSNLREGGKTTVVVNRYERELMARKECIAIFGCKCSVCDLDFSRRYGDIGIGFIHVHHLKPLSTIGKEYKVNPREDLRPVCPNCHEMLHTKRPEPLTIEDLRGRLRHEP